MWKILVADDEAMERSALQEILQQNLGCRADVRTARDGESAVETATLWGADIVLMDIEMPGRNGVRAAAAIKCRLPACQVIFLTAYGRFEYAQEAIRLEASDYILKPAEDAEVLAALHKAIRRLESAPRPAPPPRPAEPEEPRDKNAKLMAQVQEYLARNYRQDISLDGLSQVLNFSPFYLSKLFKQYLGVPFVEYLADIRIEAAKQMLADLTRSAKEIGAAVGYPNSNYFVQVFKKKTGMTPTEYRGGL